ncbi:MAG TPA: GAF domain-containing protein [Longimicrobium sp.]|jgi:uncharacterized protein YoxC
MSTVSLSPRDVQKIDEFNNHQKDRLRTQQRHLPWYEYGGSMALGIGGLLVGLALESKNSTQTVLMVALSVILFVVALYTHLAKFGIQRELQQLGELSLLDAPVQVLQLQGQVSELRHHRNSLEAWGALQHSTSQEVLQFVRQVNASLAAPNAASQQTHLETLQEIHAEFQSIAARVAQRLADKRFELFGFAGNDELFFFDILELRGEELHVIGRSKHPDAIEHRRVWRVGEGHVGYAVQRGKTVLINYDKDPRPDLDDQKRSSDEVQFRCRIAAPIPAADDRPHRAHGAICVSSNVGERLTDDHHALCANLALSLAGLFYAKEVIGKRVTGASGSG